MTLHSKLTLAALASDAMPSITVAGVRDAKQTNETDNDAAIAYAVVQDTSGRLYDIYASHEHEGDTRLAQRAKAAKLLSHTEGLNGLGFLMDAYCTFKPASSQGSGIQEAVLVTPHINGECRSLDLLTLEDCASVGTAIGTIHRLNADFLKKTQYPSFNNGEIRNQLAQWIKRLQRAGHVPGAITTNWSKVIDTDGIWEFSTCFTHGGFQDGDFVFSDSTINAITNWQRMQVNDPARDLAWTFAKLDTEHRNQVLSAYGSMMGSRLDDLIMIRANLWLQMEQVGEFIAAMKRGDNAQIVRFKAQVERLAHELTVITNRKNAKTAEALHARVGLLSPDSPKHGVQTQDTVPGRYDVDSHNVEEMNDAYDKTSSTEIRNSLSGTNTEVFGTQDIRSVLARDGKPFDGYASNKPGEYDGDDTAQRARLQGKSRTSQDEPSLSASAAPGGINKDQNPDNTRVGAAAQDSRTDKKSDISSSTTITLEKPRHPSDDEQSNVQGRGADVETQLIPKFEQEKLAIHDAQDGLDEYEERAGGDQRTNDK